MKIAAFDIGGTALKMGVMARDGRLLETARQSINASDGDRILQAMLSWLAAHPSCEGIAISAPGYIDPHSGFITMGGAIRRFDNFAMKSWLETRTGLPVSVENDANCVLLAERWQGQSGGDGQFSGAHYRYWHRWGDFLPTPADQRGAFSCRRIRLHAYRPSRRTRSSSLFNE